MVRVGIGVLQALVLLALAGCGAKEPPPPAVKAPVAVAIRKPTVLQAPVPREGFCTTLTRIVAAEATGFTPLRAGSAGDGRWQAAAVPYGFRRCGIEGSFRPVAAYVCEGAPARGRGSVVLADEFAALKDAIDACLDQPTWYPREWQAGEVRDFALGERQVTWRDITGYPKPAVQLKVEEDFRRRRYLVRLAVVTLR